MADSKPAPEPTMEEILSSIRRIIAEDEDKDDGAPHAAAHPNPTGPEGVLDLTEVVRDAEPPSSLASAPERASSPRSIGGPSSVASAAAPPASAQGRPADDDLASNHGPTPVYTRPPSLARSAGSAMPPDAADSLISADTAKASAQALARLTRANANEERRPTGGGGNVPIDQFLGDLLTPLLRDWLEQHLPGIVERVVEQEVKKLARRAELL